MRSKITGGETTFLYKARILYKYDVSFFLCNDTGFIQTQEPYWLGEAYSSAITKLDVGLVQRNLDFAELCYPLIIKYFDQNASFLDYAGGYGLFTRLMRNKGFDFYHTDKYCENLFAEFNDLKHAEPGKRFELTTAFEVFEHLHSPIWEIEHMMSYSENLLFSTVIVPKDIPKPTEWWYFSLETGQHISFFSIAALEYIARKFNKHFYTNGKTIHLFTAKRLNSDPFKISLGSYLTGKLLKKAKKLETGFIGRKLNLTDKDIRDAKQRISEMPGYSM